MKEQFKRETSGYLAACRRQKNKKYLIGIFPEKLSATEKKSFSNLLNLSFLLIALIYDHINSDKGKTS